LAGEKFGSNSSGAASFCVRSDRNQRFQIILFPKSTSC